MKVLERIKLYRLISITNSHVYDFYLIHGLHIMGVQLTEFYLEKLITSFSFSYLVTWHLIFFD
jgi:hypothetical protein